VRNWLVPVLLTAILATQILILLRMPAPPPTLRAIRNAKPGNMRLELFQGIPLVRVQGGTIDSVTTVDSITDTVNVEVENEPLQVETGP
jgi:hypothetical protein